MRPRAGAGDGSVESIVDHRWTPSVPCLYVVSRRCGLPGGAAALDAPLRVTTRVTMIDWAVGAVSWVSHVQTHETVQRRPLLLGGVDSSSPADRLFRRPTGLAGCQRTRRSRRRVRSASGSAV